MRKICTATAQQIAVYVARYPRVGEELILNDRHVDFVEEGFDLAIRIGRLADSSLIAKKIGEMRLVACAAPSYLSARGRPQTPHDLSAHDCVLYPYASTGGVWTFSGPRGGESARVSGRILCNNGEAICKIAIRDGGIIALPDFIVAPHLQSGALERVLTDYAVEPTGIYAIHPSHRHVPLKLRAFIDLLEAAFRK